jgi:hypothetical protein
MTLQLPGADAGIPKRKNRLSGISPMTGRPIPNISDFYADIRTAPGHRLFAVRQHSVQQQIRWVRLNMWPIIPMRWTGVKRAFPPSRDETAVAFDDAGSGRNFILNFPSLELTSPLLNSDPCNEMAFHRN